MTSPARRAAAFADTQADACAVAPVLPIEARPRPAEEARAGQTVGIIGLGHIGLPLAVALAMTGTAVHGVDLDPHVVAAVNEGRPRVDTVDAGQLQASRVWLTAQSDADVLSRCNVMVVCVPTPLTEDGAPDLTALCSAVRTVGTKLRPGDLVIIESTTYPGTTERVLRPLLEVGGLVAGVDFHLAYSPERVDPGNPTRPWNSTTKVIGGLTPACAQLAAAFFRPLVHSIHVARGIGEAEASKMLENVFRQVNIALVNEFARICHAMDVDVWDVIAAAATKPFGFMPFRPGPGVGGECIPVDPLYMAFAAREAGESFSLVEAAQQVNDAAPGWLAERVLDECRQRATAPRVLVVGVTYKPDVRETTNSPAVPIISRLQRQGVHVSFYDELAEGLIVDDRPVPRVVDLGAEGGAFDLVVLLQRHRGVDVDRLAALGTIFDATGTLTGEQAVRL